MNGHDQPEGFPAYIPVSIVVATLDRPDDLRECLSSLVNQETTRTIEIIVVDNHPSSGLTAPVVAEFPGVKLLIERRRGLAYARNKGFKAACGEIVVTTDDDVIVPAHWLETLLRPFVKPDVMVVTGNVVPWQLETAAQRLFEAYGGLGRGAEKRIVNGEWFRRCRTAVPTWSLGATANAAFRASIFSHQRIGLMDEALGPGMPSGVGEDTYLFYKVLKAGLKIVYEPDAYVWHKHRRDLSALRRQLFDYSKGHVAYQLTTLFRDGDLRAVTYLVFILPWIHIRRALRSIFDRSGYPLSLLLLEVAGNLVGPWALWRSRRRVKRERIGGIYD
ncbi:MAG: glycosyltransferase [Acidobacteria bacterium]|nr:glycosyltransferase [Acidobacteriota bacterium]